MPSLGSARDGGAPCPVPRARHRLSSHWPRAGGRSRSRSRSAPAWSAWSGRESGHGRRGECQRHGGAACAGGTGLRAPGRDRAPGVTPAVRGSGLPRSREPARAGIAPLPSRPSGPLQLPLVFSRSPGPAGTAAHALPAPGSENFPGAGPGANGASLGVGAAWGVPALTRDHSLASLQSQLSEELAKH